MWHNGNELPDQALDRGLQFGDGHFTTLTIENGRIRWWACHWQRLQAASERLHICLPTEAELFSCLTQLTQAHPKRDLVVKIIVTRGPGARGYGFNEQANPHWYITTTALSERTHKPLKVDIAELRLSRSEHLAGLKTLNRLEQVLLSHERQQRELDELIVLDSTEQVVEAISSNLIWRQGDSWYTPSLDYAGVNGVVRTQLLSDQPVNLDVCDTASLAQVLAADQVILTNSVLGLRPVAQIGEHRPTDPTLPKALINWWQASDVSS
ncbi:aminodeoxychorismate lyase [Pseudidiomarina halophila]|uniref:Aminodeoxychorismate lyase n=1 Tax=Pseudidiomarina halophila TaxID=1449799 RepID=A0A432Y0D8_9GAMM|nr:aminodeoxychorismate lyase [Pseudidiomarina halophila]RUO54406.1 aminodeoxychorismate lyase [Pseudidiomarina halophila]